MTRKTITLFVLLVLLGCSHTELSSPAKKTPEPKKEKVEAQYKPPETEKKKESARITDETAEARLLAYGKDNPETVVKLTTTKGAITVKLYKDTPLHRANFIMMTKMGYFNGTVFTRCVPNFIAQAGSAHNHSHMEKKEVIGKFTVPAEMDAGHIHKRGALGAARRYSANPDKRSDPFSFYFVEGLNYNEKTLDHYEKENNYTYSKYQREFYLKNPGAAHLDGQHTVFGEIISGYDVVPKLTAVETDSQDWPFVDIFVEKAEVVR